MSAKKLPIFKLLFAIAGIVWLVHLIANIYSPSSVADKPSSAPMPIEYAVDDWVDSPKKDKADLTAILALAGAGAMDDSGLDFEGKPAKVYRYHHRISVPFWVGVSDKYVEMAWYFAGVHDDNDSKALSQDYAKKSYAMTGALIGKSAKPLFKTILGGKAGSATGVVLAECQENKKECRVVISR